jgi:predicted ferric reductase
MRNKLIFYAVWVALLCLGPYVVLRTTPLSYALASRGLMANVIQRILGLIGFTLIFFQVVLGSRMMFWTDRFGGWVLRFHIFEGILAYTVIFAHTLSFLVYMYFIGHGLDPYFIYVNACIICPTSTDYYYTLGRVAFWLLTIAVFAGLFRMEPFIRNNWRKFHILNYFVFIIVALHGFFIGTDLNISIYKFFFFPAVLIVFYLVMRKLPSLLQFLSNLVKGDGYIK